MKKVFCLILFCLFSLAICGAEFDPAACPDSGKTRHGKPFLGVWWRSTEKRELLIAFSDFYAIFENGTFLNPSRLQKFDERII